MQSVVVLGETTDFFVGKKPIINFHSSLLTGSISELSAAQKGGGEGSRVTSTRRLNTYIESTEKKYTLPRSHFPFDLCKVYQAINLAAEGHFEDYKLQTKISRMRSLLAVRGSG